MKSKILFTILTVMLLAVAPAARAAGQILTYGGHYGTSGDPASQQCMDANGGAIGDVPVSVPCNDTGSQNWIFNAANVGGVSEYSYPGGPFWYTISPAPEPSLCLTIAASGSSELEPCSDSYESNQIFGLAGPQIIASSYYSGSGVYDCLNVWGGGGTSDETIGIYPCETSDEHNSDFVPQNFHLSIIYNDGSGYCIRQGTSLGSYVSIMPCEDMDGTQQWTIGSNPSLSQGNTYYQSYSRGCLEASGVDGGAFTENCGGSGQTFFFSIAPPGSSYPWGMIGGPGVTPVLSLDSAPSSHAIPTFNNYGSPSLSSQNWSYIILPSQLGN